MGGGFSTIDGTASHAALTTTHGGALQTAAMKDVANGIAGLNSGAKVNPTKQYFLTENYSTGIGQVDGFANTAVLVNGSATFDTTNHKMALSTGITSASVARFDSKTSWTPDAKVLVMNIVINNIVNGVAGTRRILLGLSGDFTSYGGLEHSAFFAMINGTWYAITWNGSTAVNTGISAPEDGSLLTIVATISAIYFYVNGVLVATNTTSLPTDALKAGAVVQSADGVTTACSVSVQKFGISVHR